MRAWRTPFHRMAAGLVLATLPAAAGCGAPASRAARGPVSEAVQQSLAGGSAAFEHDAWNALLASTVGPGGLDYRTLQDRRPELDRYLAGLAAAELRTLSPAHLKALLLNAYNALTVRSILDHPGVASIREIDGVWTEVRHDVGGFQLTLDEIEHNLLRPFFKDPRIHFAVNCASRSCAPLPPWALDGDDLDGQLEELAANFLRDPQHVQLDGKVLRLSRYFEWYGEDFTAEGWKPRADSIPAFVARYAAPGVRRAIEAGGTGLRLQFLEYDWALNAAVPPDPGRLPAAPAALASPADAGVSAGRQNVPAAADPPDPGGHDDAPGPITRLRRWITSLGPAGFVIYILAYAALTVLFVPAWPLTVGAGVAYGTVVGTLAVSAGSTLGASLAFLVGRYLLRSKVTKWIDGRPRFAAIDRAVGREGWKIVALTRLSPVFPFNLLNYAYGLTAVRFGAYVLASWVAMLPGTLLYVYIGAAGADVAEAASGSAGWGRTALQVTGVLATLLVTFLITRTARKALREAAGPLEEGEESNP